MSKIGTIAEMFDLSGRTALVTGGTGHLGQAITTALAEAGANVVVASRDRSRAERAAAELPKLGASFHVGCQLDHMVSEWTLYDVFDNLIAEYGPISILVNNGHEHCLSDLTNCTAEEFNRQLRNATGYFLLARKLRDFAVNHKMAASVIMLGSMYGLVGSYPDAYEAISPASPVSYQTLKGGILQMTRHLAVYWARDGIRVNAISPGPFPAESAPPDLVRRLSTRSPMARIGSPDELKGAVVFLASDAASYVTGHNLVVDGGWTAW